MICDDINLLIIFMNRLDNIPLNVMGGGEEIDPLSPAKKKRNIEDMD